MFSIIASFVLVSALVRALSPKPQSVRSSGLDEFEVPTVDPGRNIPVLFGTKLVRSPMVVWYGHLRSTAIRR